MSSILNTPVSRRSLLYGAGTLGIAASLGSLAGCTSGAVGGSGGRLSVLSPTAPDPAPVGVAKFGPDAEKAFSNWQKKEGVSVSYEAIPWPQLHDKLATTFSSGVEGHDVNYMSGWVPEFSSHLREIGSALPADLKNDMPKSSFSTVTRDGKIYGAVFTLSLMTLFYNHEHLQAAGLKKPPTTWDDLKGYVKELNRDGHYGWVLNYGDPAGIGGTASYWMIFLQQAGGTMYGTNGKPVFNNTAGVDALQLMIDLQKAGGDPGSISYVGINDASNIFTSGKASMMMNWPYAWGPAQNTSSSKVAGKVGSAILPAGSAGSASIDGTDAWTVASSSKNPDKALALIQFYLSPEQQKAQVLKTGWLPIRTSVLKDPEVLKAAPNAATVLEQASHPYDSFVTPDYTEVTQAIGTEVQKALQGSKTAAQALKDASDLVTAIVAKRA